jgi:hypothetical protein
MTLEEFLNECEQMATTAKKQWDDCSMHPNDMCEEVLTLVKLVRLFDVEYNKQEVEFAPDINVDDEAMRIINNESAT